MKLIFFLVFQLTGCHKAVVGKGYNSTGRPCVDSLIVNFAKKCKRINFEKSKDSEYYIFSCHHQKAAHDDSIYVNNRFFVHDVDKEIEFINATPFCVDNSTYVSIEIKNEL